MYWPSTSMNGDFFYQDKDGSDLDPDGLLSRYDDWQDESTWPVSSRQSAVEHHGSREIADPLTKPGIVGAFCRAYGMADMALQDENVKTLLAQERMAAAADDFAVSADWQKNLTYDKAGNLQNTLRNLTLILQNDEMLKAIVFNQQLDGMEIKGKVPWKHPSKY